MTPQLCSHCQNVATISLHFMLSSLGASPRIQKASSTVPYCRPCLRRLLNLMDGLPLDKLHGSLLRATSAFPDPSGRDSNPSRGPPS